jgi:hypothetical protein
MAKKIISIVAGGTAGKTKLYFLLIIEVLNIFIIKRRLRRFGSVILLETY